MALLVLHSGATKRSIIVGVIIGCIIGMEPIMGIQMGVAVAIATLLRANPLAAVLPVWITNPVTFIPIYAFNYWLGHAITGWGIGTTEYREAIHQAALQTGETGAGFWQRLAASVVDGTKELLNHGGDTFAAFIVGCTISGIIFAAILAPLTYVVMDRLRTQRKDRREQAANGRHLSARSNN
jgi:uncharacterized protein (DUF2062 family)